MKNNESLINQKITHVRLIITNQIMRNTDLSNCSVFNPYNKIIFIMLVSLYAVKLVCLRLISIFDYFIKII